MNVLIVTITFRAAPAMLERGASYIPPSEQRYPDINGDGYVTAADAALILTAAENIAAGQSSGLTPAQELLADADMDGSITADDSALVLQYAAAVSAGLITDSAASWQVYLRHWLAQKGGVI